MLSPKKLLKLVLSIVEKQVTSINLAKSHERSELWSNLLKAQNHFRKTAKKKKNSKKKQQKNSARPGKIRCWCTVCQSRPPEFPEPINKKNGTKYLVEKCIFSDNCCSR